MASMHLKSRAHGLPGHFSEHAGWDTPTTVQANNATTKRIERPTLTYPAPINVVLKAFVRYWSNSRHWSVTYDRLGSKAGARGKITLISVNSPGSVSTSIEPPCCFT